MYQTIPTYCSSQLRHSGTKIRLDLLSFQFKNTTRCNNAFYIFSNNLKRL